MRKLVLAALIALSAAACTTTGEDGERQPRERVERDDINGGCTGSRLC